MALTPTAADARCTEAGDLQDLGQLVQDDLSCRLLHLAAGGPPCATPGFPPCAGTTPAQITELVLGSEPATRTACSGST